MKAIDIREPSLQKRFFKSELGQSMVEFVVVAPLLLTLLCGILDFGWIYTNIYKVQDAAYESARYASINSTSATLATGVAEKASTASGFSSDEITVSMAKGDDDITVTVAHDVPTLTFVAGALFGRTYHATATSVVSI